MEKLFFKEEENFAATANFYKIGLYTQEHPLSCNAENIVFYRMCRYLQLHERGICRTYPTLSAQKKCNEIKQLIREYAAKYHIHIETLNSLKSYNKDTKEKAAAEKILSIIEEINGQKPD